MDLHVPCQNMCIDYVYQLPYQAGWQDLKDLFRSAGNIVRADINIGADGRPKGSGTVIFETAKDAAQAISAYLYHLRSCTRLTPLSRHVQWLRLVRADTRSPRGKSSSLWNALDKADPTRIGSLRRSFGAWVVPWWASWCSWWLQGRSARWPARQLSWRVWRRRRRRPRIQ